MLDIAQLLSEILISAYVRSYLCGRNFIVVLTLRFKINLFVLRLNKMNVVIEGSKMTKSMKLSKINILNVYFSLVFYRIPSMNHTRRIHLSLMYLQVSCQFIRPSFLFRDIPFTCFTTFRVINLVILCSLFSRLIRSCVIFLN